MMSIIKARKSLILNRISSYEMRSLCEGSFQNKNDDIDESKCYLPVIRLTKAWLSYKEPTSHSSVVDESVISATTIDLMLGLS